MTQHIRVLIVEDKFNDAKLMVHELEAAGFKPEWELVDTEDDFLARLACPHDVILADGRAPKINAHRALDILRETGSSTPLIVVTGAFSDEHAAEYMRHGAVDYLLKDRLARLGQAVRQAIEFRKRDEEKRRVEEEHLRFFQLSMDMLCVAGFDGYFKLLNPAWEAILGWTNEELLARPYLDFVHPDDRSRTVREATELAAGGSTYAFENRYRCRDGSYKWLSWRSTSDPGRGLIYATVRDMTAQRRAEADLRLRDRAIQAVSQGIVIADPTEPDCPIIYASPGFLRLTGYAADEVVGRNCRFLQGRGTDRSAVAALRSAIGDGKACTIEVLNYRKDGTPFWNEVSISPVRDDGGRLTHFVGVQTDVTERRRALEEVREWKDRYESAVKATGQILYEWAPGSNQLVLAGNLQSILGYSADDLDGGREKWLELIHPDDRDAFLKEAERARSTNAPFHLEYRMCRKDGQVISVRDDGHLLTGRGPGGDRMIGFVADVSEQKQLEEQFRHAQKMKAIGQLAGGVAHDFNNLLTIINGYSEILVEQLQAENPMRELVSEIQEAGQRSATLTRQLLAFSRQEVIAVRVLDLNAVVGDTEKMLRRLIGEDIELRVVLAPVLWPIKADRGQLEQVILNLVVNARDAMPQGGRLVIETSNHASHATKPGRFVCLEVSDTGRGMDPATMARIFEPFFTTKGENGTGLGLSTVYGIVEHIGGHIEVESEQGSGTTFRLYFPATAEKLLAGELHDSQSQLPLGTETILLAEDDDAVRTLIARILKASGYAVLEARNGEGAIDVAARYGAPIHLLVTDVVMTGLGGRETADQVVALHPETRVLFLSGYTDDAILRHGVRQAEAAFLQKPFTPSTLALRIREVLEG